MARILITTYGSYGDLYPYLALARELQNRWHRVTVATSAAYREKVEALGVAFAPVRPDVDLQDREFMKYIFDAKRGSERILRAVSGLINEMYDDAAPLVDEADVVVTHPLAFATTLIAKKRKMAWASTTLAPVQFLSAYDPPIPAPAPWFRHLRFLPRAFHRTIFRIGAGQALKWTEPVVEFGVRKLGLTRKEIGNPIFDGGYSPQLALALFSPVFCPPQPDWPASAYATGFPFFEQSGSLAPELEAFLSGGEPPVVFTLGSSAVGAAGDFYRNSYRAIEKLGVRTLFLTGDHPQGLPQNMPPTVLRWSYAPHAEIFRRASMIVHQGGIGTTAEALRSGRPMLVVPFSHDQFDNAERCRRLGVGGWISRADYNERRAIREMQRILDDTGMPERCSRIGSAIAAEHGVMNAAIAIEKITTH